MEKLLTVSRAIDRLTTWLGRTVAWLIIAAAVVAVGNAILRKFFGVSSNARIELQWVLYAAVFLIAAPWTLLSNEHIRIDIVNTRLPKRVRNWIEIAGHTLFLLPVAGVVLWTSLPFAATSIAQNEQSQNFGGLPQWPAKLLIPIAFALLLLQAISELIKRVAILRGELDEAHSGAAGRSVAASDDRHR